MRARQINPGRAVPLGSKNTKFQNSEKRAVSMISEEIKRRLPCPSSAQSASSQQWRRPLQRFDLLCLHSGLLASLYFIWKKHNHLRRFPCAPCVHSFHSDCGVLVERIFLDLNIKAIKQFRFLFTHTKQPVFLLCRKPAILKIKKDAKVRHYWITSQRQAAFFVVLVEEKRRILEGFSCQAFCCG